MSDALTECRENLERFGFPGSLLPDTVDRFTYDEDAATFAVHLSKETKVRVDAFQVVYGTTITGEIRQGHIRRLDGVIVRVNAFLKPPVRTILASEDGATITFKVGPVTKEIPRSAFA